MSSPFNAKLEAALLAFNGEVVLYCRDISDLNVREYARNYARMLQNRIQGLDFALPKVPHGLFEPNRKLIRSNLERMAQQCFPKHRS